MIAINFEFIKTSLKTLKVIRLISFRSLLYISVDLLMYFDWQTLYKYRRELFLLASHNLIFKLFKRFLISDVNVHSRC